MRTFLASETVTVGVNEISQISARQSDLYEELEQIRSDDTGEIQTESGTFDEEFWILAEIQELEDRRIRLQSVVEPSGTVTY